MKINNKILSIPPYISTAWHNISSLRVKENVLGVELLHGDIVEIPHLEKPVLEQVFAAHAQAIEEGYHHTSMPTVEQVEPRAIPGPFRLGVGLGGLQEIGTSIFEHDPRQMNIPTIPKEILEKIISVTKIVSPEELRVLSKAEKGCNCVHCQVASLLSEGQEGVEASSEEEIILERELSFQEWEVKQSGNNLFSVTNKLEPAEHYSVFLGDPIGCTCGKTGCEHIVAVLKS